MHTRRRFMETAAAIGALAGSGALPIRSARADSGPVRIALSEFVKDQSKLDSLRKGIAVMKARPGSDHRSWFFQAAVHAYNDSLYREALKRDRKVAKVDGEKYWKQCPHFGQCSADFIIWHRAYIYYFERILRDATGDPAFALPYWDYENADSRSFPEAFAPRYLDTQNTVDNSLYNANRDLGFVSGRFDLSSKICEAHNTLSAESFFHETGAPGFGGDTLDSKHTQLSLIEQRPHNDIHIAVGGVIGSVNGAMADIPTAAFDPVFWVHHANVDRIWTEWARQPNRRWGPLPDDFWFDEKPWVFLDVDGTEKSESRRYYMDRSNLGVRYDTDDASVTELQLPPSRLASMGGGADKGFAPVTVAAPAPDKPQAARRAGNVSAAPAGAAPASGAAVPGAMPQAMPEDMTAALELQFKIMAITAPVIVSPARPAKREIAAAARTGQRLLLELSDIQIAKMPSSGFAVYLDPHGHPPDNKNLAGLIDMFAATHSDVAGMSGMKTAQRFDVSRLIPVAGGAFVLRVEPYDLLVAKNGVAAPQRADAVHIGAVRFIPVS